MRSAEKALWKFQDVDVPMGIWTGVQSYRCSRCSYWKCNCADIFLSGKMIRCQNTYSAVVKLKIHTIIFTFQV